MYHAMMHYWEKCGPFSRFRLTKEIWRERSHLFQCVVPFASTARLVCIRATYVNFTYYIGDPLKELKRNTLEVLKGKSSETYYTIDSS